MPIVIRGVSYLFTLPFWVFVDTQAALTVREIILEGVSVRIYPPFRSGPANFIPMPEVNLQAVPWPPGVHQPIPAGYRIPAMAVFPNFDVDPKSSLHLVWGQEWGKDKPPPRMMPMDSLRIDVYGEPEGERDRASAELTGRLLRNLRWLTKQWWIERSVDPFMGILRSTFDVSPSGAASGDLPRPSGQGHTGRGDEKVVDAAIWDAAVQSVKWGGDPPTYDAMLLDARYFRAARDMRRFVLDAATACEQAKNLAYERLWTSIGGMGKIPPSVAPRDDLIEDLSTKLEKFVRRSYEHEHQAYFETLRALWKDRGDVAHGKQIGLDRDPLLADPTNRAYTDAIVDGVEHCMRWLETLQPSAAAVPPPETTA